MTKKALIAMSGGVDSSVAAYLMKEQGYECMGVTMKLFHNEDVGIPREHTCCSLDDIEDAASVARNLSIPHHVFNFTDNFAENVIEPFICAYENGRTPNPCIDCNRYLKFEKLFNRAKELDYDYVVTGHYAIIDFNEETGRYELKKAADPAKDQSYVLYSLTQEQLAHTLFPLGELSKPQVRELADRLGFVNAAKHDSQDICFVQDGRYTDFIRQYTGKNYPEGDFIGPEGEVIGTHKGIISYTVGQRKGLGLSLKEPLYVKEVDPESNTVRLCRNEDLFTSELDADNLNLISVAEIKEPMRVKAKVRYRHTEDWATVTQTSEDTIHVVFDQPQRAITKGQAVVLYNGDTVVGGGQII
ncbi:MAG: tRNA 2-thiouridine(34) synthase MnmA [Lachnospiraceae bacterium]